MPFNGYTTIAGTQNASGLVQVTFITDINGSGPHVTIGNTTVVVSAFADNGNLAKALCNDVHSDIAGLQPID